MKTLVLLAATAWFMMGPAGSGSATASACQYSGPGPLVQVRVADATVVKFEGGQGAAIDLPGEAHSLLWCQAAACGLVSHFLEESLVNDLVDANLRVLHSFQHETVLIDDGGFAYAVGPLVPGGRKHPFADTRVDAKTGEVLDPEGAPGDFTMAWQYAFSRQDWLYVLARESTTEITRRAGDVTLWTQTIPESVLLARSNGAVAADGANIYLSLEGYDDRRPRVVAFDLATGLPRWEHTGSGPEAGFYVLAPLPARHQLLIVTTTGPVADLVDANSGDVTWNWVPDCHIAIGPFLHLEVLDDIVLLSDCLSPTVDCAIEPHFGAISVDARGSVPAATVYSQRMKLDPQAGVVARGDD